MARGLRLFAVWKCRSVFFLSYFLSFLLPSIPFSIPLHQYFSRFACEEGVKQRATKNEAVMHLILYFFFLLFFIWATYMWNVKKIFRAVLLNLYILCCYLRTVAKFMYVYVPLIQCCLYNIVICFALSFAKRCWMDSISHSRDTDSRIYNHWMKPNGEMLHGNWISEEWKKMKMKLSNFLLSGVYS